MICVVLSGCFRVEILQQIRGLLPQLQSGHALVNLDGADDLLGHLATCASRLDRGLQLLRPVGVSPFYDLHQSSIISLICWALVGQPWAADADDCAHIAEVVPPSFPVGLRPLCVMSQISASGHGLRLPGNWMFDPCYTEVSVTPVVTAVTESGKKLVGEANDHMHCTVCQSSQTFNMSGEYRQTSGLQYMNSP